MSINLNRIASLVQRALGEILIKSRDINKLFILAAITHVDLSPDLSHGKVFITVLDEEKLEDIVTALNDAAKFFQGELARKIKIRAIPKLRFIYDESIMRGQKLSKMIDAAVADDDNHKD